VQAADSGFIALYLGVPLSWALLLWRKRRRLNPQGVSAAEALASRRQDDGLRVLTFLFEPYEPHW
jgi:hypothetical protein